MHILILDFDDIRNPLLAAGQAHATKNVGRELIKLGHKVTVLSSRYPEYKDRVEEGITYVHIGLGTRFIKLNNLVYILVAAACARRFKADIIVECSTAPVSFLGTPFFTRTPIVVLPSMLNAVEFYKKYKIPFHIWEAFAARWYGYFIAYSLNQKNKILSLNAKAKVRIIPQGVEEKYLRLKPKKGKYILFLGRFDIAQKGIDLLLKAYQLAQDKIPYPLVIAGHGPDNNKVLELIKKLKLDKHVRVKGPAYGKEKEALMQEALFTVMPSRHEEMSIWALESIAGGLPIVCFNLPEQKWLTSDVSLKATPFDIADLSHKLVSACKGDIINPIRKNTKFFARNYEWHKVAKNYERFFNHIIAQKR